MIPIIRELEMHLSEFVFNIMTYQHLAQLVHSESCHTDLITFRDPAPKRESVIGPRKVFYMDRM